MRIALAFVAMMCGAAGAYAAGTEKFCSGNTQMTWTDDGTVMELQTASSKNQFKMRGSVGSGLNGTVFEDAAGKQQVLLYGKIEMDSNPGHEDVRPIRIFNDRVFWPCER